MHLTSVGYEQQYQIVGADGVVLWQGGAIIGQAIKVTNTSTTVTIASGGAVIIDATTTFTRDDNPGTSDPMILALYGVRVAATASVGFLGFATEPIAPLKAGRVAGTGSMGMVRCAAADIPAGTLIRGSATAGLVGPVAAKDASNPVYGTVLGVSIKAAAALGATFAVGTLVVQQ